MRAFFQLLAGVVACLSLAGAALAQNSATWVPNDTGTYEWDDVNNWNPQVIPNGVGDSATFNNTNTMTINLSADHTVGSITRNLLGTTRTLTIASGDPGGGLFGKMIFDAAGAGPATLNIPTDPSTGRMNISADVTLNDDLQLNIDMPKQTSFQGAIRFTGNMDGAGGLIKNGVGYADLRTNPKNYTGATVVNAGILTVEPIAAPALSSSFTIKPGSHLEPTADGDYQLGAGSLFLGGTGVGSEGAIRPQRGASAGFNVRILNPVVLTSTTLIHSQVQGTPAAPSAGGITFAGVVSDSDPTAQLQLSAPSNGQLGTYELDQKNTYRGGTLLHGGTLRVTSAFTPDASLGAGNVTLVGDPYADGGGAAFGKLILESGLTNAIADTATLSLAGGDAPGVADDAYVDLGFGINEVVGGLILAGVAQPAGTYGATGSGATFVNDEFFAGAGMITVVPAAPPIPGDFDHNGSVNSGDLVIWKSNFGGGNGADADGDGDSDGADFLVWQQNVGQHNAVAAVTGVPEPAAACLLTVAGLAVVDRMRKR